MYRMGYSLVLTGLLVACGADPEREADALPPAQFTEERLSHAEFQLLAEGPDSGITYTWHLEDGTLLLGRQVNHRFTEEGSFLVTLEVSNAAGETASTARRLHVRNSPPEAEFGARYNRLNVTLDGSPSFDVDDNIAEYFWTVNGESMTGSPVEVNLTEPGELEVTLVVVDDFGAESEPVTQTLSVADIENTPPEAVMDLLVEKNYVRLLGANSYDADEDFLTYQWQLSDGAEYTGDFLVHAFDTPGEYQVTLTVSDGLSTDQTTAEVLIHEMDDPNRSYRKALFEARLKFLGRCGYCHRNRSPLLGLVDDVERVESELIGIAQTFSPWYLYSFPAQQNGLRHQGVIGTREIDAGDIVTDGLDIWHELVSGIAEYLGEDVNF